MSRIPDSIKYYKQGVIPPPLFSSTLTMPWSARILQKFRMLPIKPSETDLKIPYTWLLNSIFPNTANYTVVQSYKPPPSRELAEFLVLYEVKHEDKPVMVLELKPPRDFADLTKRRLADEQIRERIELLRGTSYCVIIHHYDANTACMLETCPLPTLHVLSAFGTKICYYKSCKGNPSILADPRLQTEKVPRECWDTDILEEDGVKRFKGVTSEIKSMIDSLKTASGHSQ